MKTELRDFSFTKTGYGHYKVTYTSPNTYHYWVCTITDMTLIDATKNADCPKRCDIEQLKRVVKRGTHYNAWGTKMN